MDIVQLFYLIIIFCVVFFVIIKNNKKEKDLEDNEIGKPRFELKLGTSLVGGLFFGSLGCLFFFIIDFFLSSISFSGYYSYIFFLTIILSIVFFNWGNYKNYIDKLNQYKELQRKKVEDNLRLNKLKEEQKLKEEEFRKIKHNELVEFRKNIRKRISELDTNGDGEVDLIDGESFNKLLNRNQNIIIGIDRNYIQKFVKVSTYLKTKKLNTQKIFESIGNTKDEHSLNELVFLLKNQIHTYELLVFHSLNMVTSLVESDLITFYEIYECFDQLGVFNSNWENEVSNKLTNIGDGIKELMYSIHQMENTIVNSIDNLTYVTQDSFKDLSRNVETQLSNIDSSIKFNNLLTGIQTYQMYKINQNTKRIG